MNSLSQLFQPSWYKRILGRKYSDGEAIFHKGDPGDTLFIIQAGKVAICMDDTRPEEGVVILGKGDILGITALLRNGPRVITARAVGKCWLLSVDKKRLISRMHTDPALSFRIMTKAIQRLEKLAAAFPQQPQSVSARPQAAPASSALPVSVSSLPDIRTSPIPA
ncbi:MAG: cyclic nucleotide-binding domain-containing protein [Magnetococcales bacterium]|nr:cyclic nucleotide-binding domain-containing protein [Magnetococcales bacterium]